MALLIYTLIPVTLGEPFGLLNTSNWMVFVPESFFPWTRGVSATLIDYLRSGAGLVLNTVASDLPNIVMIAIIAVITRYVIKFCKFIFAEIGRDAIAIRGFYAEWADPTYKIARFLILAFAAVVMFPYFPGHDSRAFKGISIFVGVLFSLGSAGAAGNIIAGVLLTYTRAFQIGDRVRIADTVGDVLGKTLLATRIRTVKNEDVTVPNSLVLGSHIVNFSARAANNGLILHTSVTIGYDAPWRRVHELLIASALSTQGILRTPLPFVLQTSLNDFYVACEINAYTNEPTRMAAIYAEIHQNIQDKFNKAGVEICSSHFAAVRDANHIAIPPGYVSEGYAPPAFRVQAVNGDKLTATAHEAQVGITLLPWYLLPTMDPLNVDLKQTVNLPKTAFSMKANLPQTEPKLLERWAAENLYQRIRASRAGRPTFILHDGPPYANGRIHLGTAFNKILKDFIVKSKTMAGFDSPYVPGWDCHGLPIEFNVDNDLGARKATMSKMEIRAACRKYAEKYVELQRQDFKRLGVLGQWDDPYLTMSAHYESVIAGAFVEFLDRGYVYKGLKPVHWCIRDRTALAEAEVEYQDHTSPSIWVRFKLTSDPAKIHPDLAGRTVYGLIWTTTPWTIPANMAIAYHPKFEYMAVDVAGSVYFVAAELLQVTAEKCGWVDYHTIAAFPGASIEHAVFRHPFLERDSLGILADHVTLDQGTGAVHTAPGHGQEDYVIGRQYGIEIFCPVDAGGRFFHAEGAAGRLPEELIGKTVWEANPVVIEILKSAGALLGLEKLVHSYPNCWRCHHPVIFRATEQWFIGMDRNNFRQRALEVVHRTRWMPAWGEERISNMIAARPDWCISRQRAWGVPIIVFYCDECREPLTDRKILEGIVDLFRLHGADIWYQRTAAELLPAGTKCAKCGSREFSKENDILDVWFDSGSSHLAVLNERFGLSWPADVYMEGGDQYRGWFHSSLLVGTGLKGGSPYRMCVLNGWVLDGEGRAMHKSLGNVIEPDQIIRRHGAEILRLWTASVEFNEDVRLSETILTRLVDAYRKLRNTFRYLLGNLSDFDPLRDAVPGSELAGIDQWILLRAEDLAARCRVWYENFEFHKVYHSVYAFATVDLSAVYFDILKDRLYTAATKSPARRSAQTALYRLLDALVRLMAPLMSFTAEEVWGHMGRTESVHIACFPEPSELTAGFDLAARQCAQDWDRLMEVRDTVLKSLEAARNEKLIGAPLEACVRLSAGADLYPLLEQYARELPALFIVSQVALDRADTLSVGVERAAGRKCERCWKYTIDIGVDTRFPTICGACAEAVEEIWHDRH